MSRSFTSSGTSRITFDIGTNNFSGQQNWACILRRTTDAVLHVVSYFGTATTGSNRVQFAILADNTIQMREGANTQAASSLTAADGWCLIAVGKDSNGTPRFHKYVYDTRTWTHTNAGGTLANGGNPATSCYIGDWSSGGDAFGGDIAVVARWNAPAFSDQQVESLVGGFGAWFSPGNPASLWVLDQETTSQSVPDLRGNGGNQSAIITTGMGIGANAPWTPGQGALAC